MKGREGFKVLV